MGGEPPSGSWFQIWAQSSRKAHIKRHLRSSSSVFWKLIPSPCFPRCLLLQLFVNGFLLFLVHSKTAGQPVDKGPKSKKSGGFRMDKWNLGKIGKRTTFFQKLLWLPIAQKTEYSFSSLACDSFTRSIIWLSLLFKVFHVHYLRLYHSPTWLGKTLDHWGVRWLS